MAYDKVVDSNALNANLTSIANAIREKAGVEDTFAFPAGFVEAIAGISSGVNIHDMNVVVGTITLSVDQTSSFYVEIPEYDSAKDEKYTFIWFTDVEYTSEANPDPTYPRAAFGMHRNIVYRYQNGTYADASCCGYLDRYSSAKTGGLQIILSTTDARIQIIPSSTIPLKAGHTIKWILLEEK